ncbi:hypothetical protein [Natrinema salinisoli]|uniref:hypothetical protein n=1 Tax=Natrinema salinisoli TaxID=2878535 RepID=UPI001CF01320|nr:hypothetical protein [Natrinema salinisoli]
MADIVLSLVVTVFFVQYSLWLFLHVDIRRNGYTDPEITGLPMLTSRLPLLGIVVPLWYLYHRSGFCSEE